MSPTDLEQGIGRRLLRNLTMQSGTQAVSIVLGLVSTYVLVRYLGPESFGGFTYLFSFIYIFLALNDLGTGMTLVREIAQTPSRTIELVQNILGLRLVLSVLSLAIGYSVIALLPLPAAYKLSLRVFLLILPIQAFATPAVILQANLQMGRGSVVEMANRLTGFGLMMWSVLSGHGLLFVTLSLVCGEVVGVAAVALFTYRVAMPRPRFDFAVWRRVVRLSLPLSGNSLLVALLNKFDALMLQALGDLTQVGFYGSAYRLPNLIERVPTLVMATLFPVMSQLAVRDPIALRRLYRKTLFGLAALVVPMLIGVIGLAPLIVRVWFGPDYAPVVPLLRVVILSTALVYLGIAGGNLLVALNRTKANFAAMASATAINLALNFVWIPSYGAMGAAWATVVGFGVLSGSTLVLAELALARSVREHSAPALEGT